MSVFTYVLHVYHIHRTGTQKLHKHKMEIRLLMTIFSIFLNSQNSISKSQSGSVPIQEQHNSHLSSTCKNYIYFTLNNNMCIITWVRMLIVQRMFEFVCVMTCRWCWLWWSFWIEHSRPSSTRQCSWTWNLLACTTEEVIHVKIN